MLKSRTNAGDIIAFRLVSGEEVVGKFMETNGSSIVVSKPHMIQLVRVSASEAMPQLLPIMISAAAGAAVTFSLANMTVEPMGVSADMVSAYTQSTSSLDLSAAAAKSTLIRP